MSPERRQALGRRESDYEAAALREKVAEHEAHFTHLRPMVAEIRRDLDGIKAMLRSDPRPDVSALEAKIREIEDALKEHFAP